ncbi:hypothetical protein R5O24_02810 [Tenacibaculum maritimum]|uniref:hypothetical protein n=1 Tax=Tenacibaculum maritimum TaxID=107401 RepID=UPI003890EBFB
MSENEKLYMTYLERLRLKLIKKYDELGLRASGKYEDELEVQVKGNTLTMWGAYHSIFMESGRGSGGFPPRKAIEDWIETKDGLPPIFKEKKRQFAFIIARKIAEEGITVPNEYNKGKVVSEVLEGFLANDIYEMLDELGLIWTRRITSDIKQIFKQAA